MEMEQDVIQRKNRENLARNLLQIKDDNDEEDEEDLNGTSPNGSSCMTTTDDVIDDIEDLINSSSRKGGQAESKLTVNTKYSKPNVLVRKHLQNGNGNTTNGNGNLNGNLNGNETGNVTDKDNGVHGDSFIPGTSSIYLKTWGCAHNNSDSEYMAGLLSKQGYTILTTEDRKSQADLWILNSCTVKNPAEDHFRNEVESGLKSGKKVVVGGCVPQGKPKAEYIRGLSVIGVQQIDRVVEVVEETLKGNAVRLLGPKKDPGSHKKSGGASLDLPKIRRNPLIEIIAINTGCLNQCTYCKTKHARGELGSYPIAEIVQRAVRSFEEGVVEIWLTSEDTGAYGRDIDTNLPELLWELVKVIPEGCKLRLGMTNPPYIMDHLDEMAKILNHDRVYKFLHVPVQSGGRRRT